MFPRNQPSVYKLVCTMFLALLISHDCFAEGHETGGGGEGIIYSDGQVELADLVDSNDLPVDPVSEKQIYSLFFKGSRYVKSFAQKDEHFFECAVDLLKDENSIVFQRLREALKGTSASLVEIRLQKTPTEGLQQPLPLVGNTSSRMAERFQEPLAVYNDSSLWVSRRFYQALSQKSKCGLQLHEALRVLNGRGITVQKLNTVEIEAVVRSYLGKSDDTGALALARVKLSENLPEALSVHDRLNKLAAELGAFVPSLPDGLRPTLLHAVGSIHTARNELEIGKELNSIAQNLLDEGNALLLLKEENQSSPQKISDQQCTILSRFTDDLLDQAGKLATLSAMKSSSEVESHLVAGSLSLEMATVHSFSGSKWLDAWKQEIVTRLNF